ncbi:MAG: hypothetical protein Q8S84_09505 [bacterium]|nr:hypothetical protein [bacterium]MDP3381651.1 hypothetical protein [bacterium]
MSFIYLFRTLFIIILQLVLPTFHVIHITKGFVLAIYILVKNANV